MAKKIVMIICVLIFSLSCSKGKEYHVAMPALPEKIDPIDADLNYALYIIKQLYEPLFVFSSTSQAHSNILQDWSSFDDHTKYFFQLKKGITFSNERVLSPDILKENLEYFSQKGLIKKSISAISIKDDHLDVVFKESYPEFTYDLTSYKTAIVDPDTRNSNVVVGISPYRVVEITPKMIHLTTDKKLNFRDIYLHKWSPEDNLPLWSFDDINMISSRYIPADIGAHMKKYDVNVLATVVLLINHGDPVVRKYLFNCIDYSKLRSILYPNKESFRDVGGILPVGLMGAVESHVEQKCSMKPLQKKVEIYMPTFFMERVDDLRTFFHDSLEGLNIKVLVDPVDVNDITQIYRSKDKKYDLSIIGMDAQYALSYFDYFLDGTSMWVRVENPTLENIIKKYYLSSNDDEKNELIQEANRELVKNYQTLPLFQIERPFYFSKKVDSMVSDQLFFGIPKISEL